MAIEQDQTSASLETQEKNLNDPPMPYGGQKYGRLMKLMREGWVSVAVYKNVFETRIFYDTVVYRKFRGNGQPYFKRGGNFKPEDLAIVIKLLGEASEYITSILAEDHHV